MSEPGEHEIQQALTQAIQAQAQRMLGAIQEACQSIWETHRGRPVEEITPLLRDALAQRWVDPSLAERFAGFIAAGKQVRIKANVTAKD
jgi:hypothetical protein